MKKLLALLLAMLLVLSLAACGKDEGGKSDRDEPSKSDKEDSDTGKDPFEGLLPDDPNEPEDTAGTPEYGDPFGPEVLALIASVNEDNAETTGTCGADLTWYLYDNMLIIRGTGEMEDYAPDDAPWSEAADQIELVYLEDGVTSIGNLAFYYFVKMQAVYIPDSVTAIRIDAFGSCGNLTYVRWSENLTEIGTNAFESAGLTSAAIPEGVTSLADGVFMYNMGLTSVDLPEGLTKIGNNAFQACKLTSVTIPDSVTTIGTGAFYSNSLTEVTIPASVTSLLSQAFGNCPITTVTFLGDAPETDGSRSNLFGLKAGTTIRYSGDSFDRYIEDCPDYNWVKI